MDFLLGALAVIYGLGFIVTLLLQLLGIGIDGGGDGVWRVFRYIVAIASAVVWPATLLYGIYSALNQPASVHIPSEEVRFRRLEPGKYSDKEFNWFFKAHPLVESLTVEEYSSGLRVVMLSFKHRPRILALNELRPESRLARNTLKIAEAIPAFFEDEEAADTVSR